MRASIQRWGNSLALRIPKAFAVDLGLEKNTAVEIALGDGCLVVRPFSRPEYKLSGLLDGITADNVHSEIDPGEAVGGEVW